MPKYLPLAKEFPEQAMLIRRTIMTDSDFAAICDDYIACVAAINHWAAKPAQDGRVQEYRRTLGEIKAEVARFLGRLDARSLGPLPGNGPSENDIGPVHDPLIHSEKRR